MNAKRRATAEAGRGTLQPIGAARHTYMYISADHPVFFSPTVTQGGKSGFKMRFREEPGEREKKGMEGRRGGFLGKMMHTMEDDLRLYKVGNATVEYRVWAEGVHVKMLLHRSARALHSFTSERRLLIGT